jgi:hypothetical protein
MGAKGVRKGVADGQGWLRSLGGIVFRGTEGRYVPLGWLAVRHRRGTRKRCALGGQHHCVSGVSLAGRLHGLMMVPQCLECARMGAGWGAY